MSRIDFALLLLVSVLGFALCWQIGRIGYLPLDQSIVFDGAWRVVSGQVPWRDFITPNGLSPILMQALVFQLFGVSWATYVGHAAALNAVGSGAVYGFLRSCQLARPLSLACGILTAVCLCTPCGTPYMDTHAMFFSLLAVMTAWLARDRHNGWLWAGSGVLLVLGVFAKQIPTVLVLPAVMLAVASDNSGHRWRPAVILALSALLMTAIAMFLLSLWGADRGLMWEHLVRIPFVVGGVRQAGLVAHFTDAIAAMVKQLPCTSLVMFVCCAMALVARWAAPHDLRPMLKWPVLGVLVLLACWSFTAMTINQYEQGMGPIPLAAGVCLIGLQATISKSASSLANAVRSALVIVVAAALVSDAFSFHKNVNLTRMVQDMQLEEPGLSTWRASADLPPVLRNLGFTVWANGGYSALHASFADLLAYLERDRRRFILLGDETIVYGLVGQPFPTPFLWYHPGLVWLRDQRSSVEMDLWLNDNLTRLGVSRVIIPDNTSWWGWTAASFPILLSRIAPRSECQSVGRYTICDLR